MLKDQANISPLLPELKSERLVLTCFTEQDVRESYECITPTLTKYMAWERPNSLADYALVWQAWLRHMYKGEEYIFVIRDLQSHKFIGLVGIHQFKTQSPTLGVWIREDEHGHGYGREAVYIVAEWANESAEIDHFIYPVAEQNFPSRRIAELMGGTVIEQIEKPKYLSLTYRIDLPLKKL